LHVLAPYLGGGIGKFAMQVVPDPVIDDRDMVGEVKPGGGDEKRNEDEQNQV